MINKNTKNKTPEIKSSFTIIGSNGKNEDPEEEFLSQNGKSTKEKTENNFTPIKDGSLGKQIPNTFNSNDMNNSPKI